MNEVKLETASETLELKLNDDGERVDDGGCEPGTAETNGTTTKELEFSIPPNLLGHDLSAPYSEEDSSRSGKRLPKPRPGVKVPYRHLASTIVTPDEIAQEILERSWKKYNNYMSVDANNTVYPVQNVAQDQGSVVLQKSSEESSTNLVGGSGNSTIKDADELLSILEGNEKSMEKKSKNSGAHTSPYKVIKLYPDLERELALKQLSEFTTPSRKKKTPTPGSKLNDKKRSMEGKKVDKGKILTLKPGGKQSEVKSRTKNEKKQTNAAGKRKLNAEHNQRPKKKKNVPTNTNGKADEESDVWEQLDTQLATVTDTSTVDDTILPIDPPMEDTKNVRKFFNKRKLLKNDSIAGTSSVHVNGMDKCEENRDCDNNTTDPIPKNKKTSANKKSDSSSSDKEGATDDSSAPVDIPVKKTRAMREIERLLGDEGAINMIYSVEQKRTPGNEPSRRGILPSTRRKKKDLLLKTKLVKNAVLRLSTSPSQGLAKTALRARRDSSTPSISEVKSPKHESLVGDALQPSSPFVSPSMSPEASRIIRRHSSSSSYSSRSNSPRRSSVDMEKAFPPSSPLSSPDRLASEFEANSPKKSLLSLSPSLDKQSSSGSSPTFLNNNTLNLSNNDPLPKAGRSPRRLLKREEINEILRRASGDTASKDTPVVFKRDMHDKLNAEISRTIMKNIMAAKLDKSNRRLDETEIENFVRGVSSSEKRPSTVTSTSSAEPSTSFASSKSESSSPLPVPTSPTPTSYSNLVKSITNDSQKKRESDNEKIRTHRQSSGGSHSYKEISLRRYDHLVQIILTPISTKMKNAFNSQVFKEMSSVLACLRKDESCRVVLMTSTGSAFCHGIDITALMQPSYDKRKAAAIEMLLAMKEFVKSLATFNKPLIAGVHGAAVGLGVTMLPFFDMVFASDKATFHTPYARLGQVPEGAATLTLPQMLGNAVTSELLFGCRKLTASEALHFGLVTRILWPDRFQEELIPLIRGIATQSSQSMEATKALLRHSLCTKLEPALLSESQLLLCHWTSDECQHCFRQYLEEETPTMQK
ncbi:uncharacterized protein LOC111046606 [Nilaparvata lugens]|uniref:uncharacterized protein LOC111046606 n=1 Tax=Nilaparvata lugens TaxID=108931 RepID=UPI00193CB4ED|nr:uncharacterized protein LOC111046606 [Nilaparvata lugens]XP_039284693.1 uncharacterized protein LOC111046606 [Nilaparvata lugens]XP_039284694.1 uncharacterized protein LOC111046606 [Nilaparvata lugens]